MSETETEPLAEPATEDVEPDEDEDEPTEDEGEQEGEEQPEAEAAGTVILTDKEEKKQETALEAEALRHAKRINQILGEGALALIPCECCHKNTPGWHYPARAFEPGSNEYALYSMLAGGSGADHKHPDYFVTCEECNGYGNVLTGAQLGLITYEIACPVCKTMGYIDRREQQSAVASAPAPVNGSPIEATVDVSEGPDWWGRPLGHPRHGKFPVFLTPSERAEDLAAGYQVAIG